MEKNHCVVFITDKAYFHRFLHTCSQLLTNGNYRGNICLVIGDDLLNDNMLQHEIIVKNNIVMKHFPNIHFNEKFLQVNNTLNTDGRNITKKFQWHKLHLFNTFFKRWDYVFYLDCGITIFSDVSPMIHEMKENTLLAHSDAYPIYEWKLQCQFDKDIDEYFSKLNNTYNLNVDYFQTTIMLYDTNIIEEDTFVNLLNLSLEYPISRTNEQGIMALYFTNIKPFFEQIKTHNEYTHFYDYLPRNNSNRYIMLKSP